jgi:hypothetical protein
MSAAPAVAAAAVIADAEDETWREAKRSTLKSAVVRKKAAMGNQEKMGGKPRVPVNAAKKRQKADASAQPHPKTRSPACEPPYDADRRACVDDRAATPATSATRRTSEPANDECLTYGEATLDVAIKHARADMSAPADPDTDPATARARGAPSAATSETSGTGSAISATNATTVANACDANVPTFRV